MIAFIARRFGSGAFLLLIISTIAYFLMFFSSTNVAMNILGEDATSEAILAKQQELGLDQPILERYWAWLTHAITGDFGISWFTNEDIVKTILARLPVTMTLVLGAILIAAILATILGMTAAVKGGAIDRLVQFLAIAGFAVPNFVVAIFLVTLFAIQIPIFNAVGYTDFAENPGEWAKSITLPVAALALSALAAVAQQVRGSVTDAINMDYVRTLRARGLSFNRVVYKHVLRNAGGPALSILGVQFVGMLGGSVLVEQIFAIPGLGPYAVSSTAVSDIPAVMGLVVVTALVVIVVNLIIDLLSAALNPKVRLS